jgi:hypothetical protein
MANNYNTTLQSNNTDLQAILSTINTLPNAGGDPVLQDKTVTPTTSKQTITADSGYDGLDTVIVNAMPTATQATPSITVSSAGLITASSTQSAGYVASGTKSATKQLTTQAAQTITPGTSNKTIASGRYLTGTQTIKGDANLVAGNIKQGVTIFGVTGTHAGGENLEAVIAAQEALIAELSTTLNNKASGGSGGTPTIKTFTCDVDAAGGQLILNRPYIDGMTWEEYVDSALNFENYNGTLYNACYSLDGDYVEIQNGAGFNVCVSIDGTATGRVLKTDTINAVDYSHYIDSNAGWI